MARHLKVRLANPAERRQLRETLEESTDTRLRSCIYRGVGSHFQHAGVCFPSTKAMRGEGNQYLLVVYWQKLEDHTVGFRSFPKYHEWKKLLRHFYDPFPTVEHGQLIQNYPATLD